MHNCGIRMTALLECFKWALNKPRSTTRGMVFPCFFLTMLSMPSSWGSTFGATSVYYN